MNSIQSRRRPRRWWPPAFLEELRCEGESECVLELIRSFAYFTVARLQLLSDPRARREWETTFKELLNLKNSCRQMGADVMASLCQQIEVRASEVETDETLSFLRALQEESRLVIHDMYDYLVCLKTQVLMSEKWAANHPPRVTDAAVSGIMHVWHCDGMRSVGFEHLDHLLWRAIRRAEFLDGDRSR